MNSSTSHPPRAPAIAPPMSFAPVSIAPRPLLPKPSSLPSQVSLASVEPAAVRVEPPISLSQKTPKALGKSRKSVKKRGGSKKKGSDAENPVSTSPVSSRKSRSAARRLTDQDVYELIRFWGQNYNTYERSGAKLFSKKAAEHLNLRWIPQCVDKTPVTPKSIETKFRYLTDKYRAVVDKMSQSGFGNEETDPPSLAETKRKLFKFYDDVHSFMGSRSNNVPDLVVQFIRHDGITQKDANRDYGNVTGDAVIEVEDDSTAKEISNDLPKDLDVSDGKDKELDEIDGGVEREERNSGNGSNSVARVVVDSDEDVEPRRKKRKLVSDMNGEGSKQTPVMSEGRSGTRKSLERVSFAQRITENSALFAENAQKSLEKSLEVMEKDVSLKEKELSVLERTANIQEREVKTREREVDMKGAENLCNQLKAQEHALREQAAMFRSWGDLEEAKKCMREARDLVKKIADLTHTSN